MRVLFTGSGSAGSWLIRGQQLGKSMSAKVAKQATQAQCDRADMIVVVKRCNPALLMNLKRAKRPWAYDILDAYPQPLCTQWDRERSISWVRNRVSSLNPTAVIWPNRRMMEDCSDGRPGFVLYHHHRPSLAVHKPADEFTSVAYEGSAAYLGRWRGIIEDACRRRDLTFTINPNSIASFDVVVAFRDGPYNGYAQRHWKSNVKLANAQGAGMPFIGSSEDGYKETSSGKELFVHDADSLDVALGILSDTNSRQAISEQMSKMKYSVTDAANDLKAFLHEM